jgi:alpha-mannosidase
MRITAVTCTELFIGEAEHPRQVLQVTVDGPPGEVRIAVHGPGVTGAATTDGKVPVEVGVHCDSPPGTQIQIQVTAEAGDEQDTTEALLVVAEPGWTVWMVSHFHYDPVWWNTQAAYLATWDQPGQGGTVFRQGFQQAGFELVRLHMETARRDPDYKFVLAEVDYLKPYWDTHPQDRAYLRRLLAEGRLELMGGTYNEPNTNLTSAESTIRNLVYGVGFQRDVLGGEPRTAWQLDAFGHDPQFPGLVAGAGLDSSSWARGPHHQWGPMLWTHEPREDGWSEPTGMQFPSEFEWLSPSGAGVLTHYMPAHYSAGWQIDSQPTLAEAEHSVYELFLLLRQVSATRNVLLPVGTDYTPPAKWLTEIHRDWNARYRWPRFVCALPREFFAAVRQQLVRDDVRPSPQTRDMNPIYTGKDVSFIDTKQAQRRAEALLTEAETFATIAATGGVPYPHAEIDRAWRQLVYGAHHDAITGSQSDQVYLDLLTGWREAYDLAAQVRERALRGLGAKLTEPGHNGDGVQRIVVFNPLSWPRTDLVRVRADFPLPGMHGVRVGDEPVLLENPVRHLDGSLAAVDVVFRAAEVPSVGYRTWPLTGTREPSAIGWQPLETEPVIANESFALAVDPERGGCVSRLTDLRAGRELLQPGRIGNELLIYEEYSAHPRFHEGPWHLLPKGAAVHASGQAPATSVRAEHSPLGQRLTVTGTAGPLRYTQRLTLWNSGDRVDATTEIHEFDGANQLVRLRWPADVRGALPVSEVGNAVVGRGFGIIDVDAAEAPWTLDNPAHRWFALSRTAQVDICDPDGARRHTRALGVAEVIVADRPDEARDLVTALVRQGVTATTATATGTRYGRLAVDSNLPDVRIALGDPDTNPFVAAVLAAADPAYAAELDYRLAATGRARLWVPATSALTAVWLPNADLTGERALPVLIVVGADEMREVCAELGQARIAVRQPAFLITDPDPDLDDYTVGIVNQGTPGFAVDSGGALHLSLMRSCTGWPSGVWIDPPRRTVPDGSNFQQQHWTHAFDYAVVAGTGDWRAAGLVRHGHEVNHPLTGLVIASGSPRKRSFVSVEPAGQVALAALKPAGHPLAGGRRLPSAVDSVVVRLFETSGRPASVRLNMWTPVHSVREADLLDQPIEHAPIAADRVTVQLFGTAIRQLLLEMYPVPAGTVDADPVAPSPEPAYARYWMHNSGPAPTGNLPVTVHSEPAIAPVAGPVQLSVTVVSDRTDEHATGDVTMLAPKGWQCEPATWQYDLEPGGHHARNVTVTAPAGAADGAYWVRAHIEPDGRAVEDVARLLVGVEVPETVEAVPAVAAVLLSPGQDNVLEVELSSDAATAVTVEAQLISPWHTWELFPAPTQTVTVAPRGRSRVRFPVRVPLGHLAGDWWAVVKLAYAGRLHYTPAIPVSVMPTAAPAEIPAANTEAAS